MTTGQPLDHATSEVTAWPHPARLHDLDALRGFAMLLGIALHTSLAFFPGFWVVVDSTADKDNRYDEFFHAVHGFRMPLFFLLSGFFTMLYWRRRGPRALVRQRLLRVALPFAIFVLPMGLLMTFAVDRAIDAGIDDYIEQNGDIWAAVFFGSEDAVERLLDDGIDVNAPNPTEGGDTPLHVAAFTGDAEMAELLIERGANTSAVAAGGRPIDYAIFVGSEELADLLVEAGADDLRPQGGEWADIGFWAEGAGEAEAIEEDLALDPWVGSGWAKNLNHLWFLWFLLWLVAGFVVITGIGDRLLRERSPPTRRSSLIMWALIPLTLLPQLRMGDEGAAPVFGPDTSTGWIPTWHVFAYYAVFFAFGALLYGRPNRRGDQLVVTIGRWWPILLLVAAMAFVVALDLTFDEGRLWATASTAQVIYTWLMIIGLMGLFRTLLATERRGVRYLSDSAYWLYLAHLPVVIVAQTAIRQFDVPAALKFGALTASVIAALLISYQLFVRYTPVGTLLNGPRTRPTAAAQDQTKPQILH